jgi:hypothetical protein
MHDREEPEPFPGRETIPSEAADQPHDRLTQELRAALRHPVELPAGLADRIVHTVLTAHPEGGFSVAGQGPQATGPSRKQTRVAWKRAVAAVLLFGVLMGAGSGYLLGRKAREQQVRQAGAQFGLAMEITGTVLRDVRAQVQAQLGQAATAAVAKSR